MIEAGTLLTHTAFGVAGLWPPESEPIILHRNPIIEAVRAKSFKTSMQGTSAFWKLVGVHYLGCVGHAIVIVYAASIAAQAGIDAVSAAGILGTLAGVSLLTHFATPVIADYLRSKWTMATMFLLQGGAGAIVVLGPGAIEVLSVRCHLRHRVRR